MRRDAAGAELAKISRASEHDDQHHPARLPRRAGERRWRAGRARGRQGHTRVRWEAIEQRAGRSRPQLLCASDRHPHSQFYGVNAAYRRGLVGFCCGPKRFDQNRQREAGFIPASCGGSIPASCGSYISVSCGGYISVSCGGYIPASCGG